jgi:hypothetical protein
MLVCLIDFVRRKRRGPLEAWRQPAALTIRIAAVPENRVQRPPALSGHSVHRLNGLVRVGGPGNLERQTNRSMKRQHQG